MRLNKKKQPKSKIMRENN